ncbi:energy transducer TonB [Pseudomonas cichorii]|uniref:energy transducer TonB n=1 Tax=Pseudomonas cichorii TaxID=36746 RepID=UPI001C8AC125|nr:energy transducer TonB [Pseudomonas cichorii]MBX8528753.1 energy transducer TonB [Pseudomonas cichorii]MBX8573595.1 energy transducer TonB [Pseudomonas cichorii]
MNTMTLELESRGSRAMDWSTLRKNGLAAAIAFGLHGAVLGALLFGWSLQEKPAEPVRTMTTQLFILPPEPAPAPAIAPVIEPVVEPAPVVAKPIEAPRPQVDTQRQVHQLEQAALARKRVEEQKREQRQHAQEIEQQRVAQQQQAEQQRQAEQARQTAERARQAQQQTTSAADNSQYQPVSKEAPDYPQRALDKGIEGDCTVIYDVSPQGRVVNPQIQGTCHPLFIRPSMTAAETFRYQPRIVEGRAVTVSGVKNTFHYRISQ